MFTGLIQHIGRVVSSEATTSGRAIVLDTIGWEHHAMPGQSIAVNGCCLTVAACDHAKHRLQSDVIPQTLSCTTLGNLVAGDGVNLEHAVTPTTLLGGHIVQGHVDGIGWAHRIVDQDADPGSSEWRVRIVPPAHLMACLPPQGSVCVDGVSLTIAAIGRNADGHPAAGAGWFEVALIPTTLAVTTLSRIGEDPVAVNLEADYLIRAMLHARDITGWDG
ncbi:MAG: riboflavin synthase [Phycisphaerales bacterium]